MLSPIPNQPWRRDPENPLRILDSAGLPVCEVMLLPGMSAEDARHRADTCANLIAAAPELRDANYIAACAIDTIYPGWSDEQILEANSEGQYAISARRELRRSGFRADGITRDGQIPPEGTYA